ncbi:DUF4249 domain-containing protein [Parapedobacter deserti]|uniref:DUF4249 domain-containing protein n=1 Tax=Parapedobacter deserti TaxID=1912957 RepID=A0ABV7JFR4_9SPHI
MLKYYRIALLATGFLWASCEDLIDINLNDADPKLVIAASVSNRLEQQRVVISRTVAFSSNSAFDPIANAEVTMTDGGGRLYKFTESQPGIYTNLFQGKEGERYELVVAVEGQVFTAVSIMPPRVMPDSIGTAVRSIFGEEQKFVAVKYQDPPGRNYYRFLWSVNNSPFKMLRVTDDKYNDGRYVSEDVTDFETELVAGDSVVIWMQSIDKPAFDFWNAVGSINPGSAAPANPPSVFGDGALGYFSAHALSEISTVVQ